MRGSRENNMSHKSSEKKNFLGFQKTRRKPFWFYPGSLSRAFVVCILTEGSPKVFWLSQSQHKNSEISSMSRKKKMSLTSLRNVFCYHILTSESCHNYGLRKPQCIWLFMTHQYQFIELKVMVQNVLRWPCASVQWSVILHVPEHFELIHIYTLIHAKFVHFFNRWLMG